MAPERSWTIAWNEREAQFFARYRKFTSASGGDAWGTKRIPRTLRRHQQLDAERWMIDWYSKHMQTGGLNAPASQIVSAAKTLHLLGPRWLQYRYDDRGTKINTYKGLKLSLNNWILDSERFEHASIQMLDMERDFTAEVCLGWISSLAGGASSVLRKPRHRHDRRGGRL